MLDPKPSLAAALIVACAIVSLITLAAGSTAVAQEPAPDGTTEAAESADDTSSGADADGDDEEDGDDENADPSAYDTAMAAGLAALGEETWEEALSHFEDAHRRSPSAEALRGVGMAAFGLRRWSDAHRALNLALEEPSRPLSEAQRTETEAILGRTLGHMGRLTVPAAPEGATLTVDDEPAPVEGAWPAEEGVVVVPSGLHRFQIRLPDGRSATSDYGVAGGEEGPLEIDLAELDEPAPAPAGSSEDPGPDVDDDDAASAGIDEDPFPAAWALFGVGLSTAVVGGVLISVGVSDAVRPDREEAAGPVLRGTGMAAAAVGGLLALLGLVIALTEEAEDDETEEPSARLTPDGFVARW